MCTTPCCSISPHCAVRGRRVRRHDHDYGERRAARSGGRHERRAAAGNARPAPAPGGGGAQQVAHTRPAGTGRHERCRWRQLRAGALRRGRMSNTLVDIAAPQDAPLVIADRTFTSRLIVGTGKYRSNDEMIRAIDASGAEMVTVAVRRVDLDRTKEEGILHHLDTQRYFLLPNTAGCYTAEDAVRYARLGRAAGISDWVKLEVIGDQRTLLPDVFATLEAAKQLVAEGFHVLAYTNEDVVTALRLEDAGCAAVMPLASPIGSGLGLLNPLSIRTIKRRLHVPVIVDAGVGTASDACVTMEQGVDGILMNTAIAAAQDPVAMATAMRLAVEASRLAFLAGRMPRREVAMPSSPTRGLLD